MADLTLKSEQLIELAPVLSAVENLSPPPTAKGRYALAKAADKVLPAFKVFSEQDLKLAQRVATKDKDDKPVLTHIGNGQFHFDVRPECQEEYTKEKADLLAEEVTLTGVRMITHAELGACPITAAQERVLIACGLLEDKEPA